MDWLKEKFRKDSFFLHSILIFVFTFIMIGFSSNGLRLFALNILEIGLGSLLATIMLSVFVMPGSEKEEKKFPVFLFWAVIAFMWTLGKF